MIPLAYGERRGKASLTMPDLKELCWKIGESFVKVKGNPADIYGKIYEERKAP